MDKNCKNYGSSWCADFECGECPMRDIQPTQPDESLLLSDEEIEIAPLLIGDLPSEEYEFFLTNQRNADHKHYLAQLAHCQPIIEARKDKECEQKLRGIFEEIETELEKLYEQYDDAGNRTDDDAKVITKIYLFGSSRWCVLKSKYLKDRMEE